MTPDTSKIQVYWDVSLSKSMVCLILIMKAKQSLKSSGTAHPAIQCYVPEDLNIQQHHCKNLKSPTNTFLYTKMNWSCLPINNIASFWLILFLSLYGTFQKDTWTNKRITSGNFSAIIPFGCGIPPQFCNRRCDSCVHFGFGDELTRSIIRSSSSSVINSGM